MPRSGGDGLFSWRHVLDFIVGRRGLPDFLRRRSLGVARVSLSRLEFLRAEFVSGRREPRGLAVGVELVETGPGSGVLVFFEERRLRSAFVFEELDERLDDGFLRFGTGVCFARVLLEQLAGLLVRQRHELDELFVVDERVGFFVNASEDGEQHLFGDFFVVRHQEREDAA